MSPTENTALMPLSAASAQPTIGMGVETPSAAPAWWGGALSHLIARGYFGQVRLRNPTALPTHGPVLYLALHRNGALDGFVYRAALARPFVPVLSTNLHRSWLGKILFPGLSVSRAKDRAQGSTNARANLAALERCVETLAANHDVLIFPEGTSALGPVPLPFETGAASLAQRFLKTHSQLTIVPLSVRYDAPWSYGSTAEVLAGPPITVHSADIKAGQDGKTVLHQQFSEALETLFHRHHFGDADLTIRHRQPWQTVLGLCSLPLCALALLLCAPALLAGFGAGRLLADGPNVISLWRVLIGGPVLLFWLPLLLLALGLLTSPLIAAGAGLSILGGLRQVGAARTALSLWRAQPPQTRRIR